MILTRRDFLKASAAIAGAIAAASGGLGRIRAALARETDAGGLPVVWLQAQSCSGCSVSLLNSVHYNTIDHLLINTLDLQYHPTLMAAAGESARAEAEAARRRGGYVLAVEGSVPSGAGGEFCTVWDGMTAQAAVQAFAPGATVILAVGTCAAFGGMPGGSPNPTGARGLRDLGLAKPIINLPGCPVHPDWVVGTIACLLAGGKAPALDSLGRPTDFYGTKVHDNCPNLNAYNSNYAKHVNDKPRDSKPANHCLTCHTNTDTHIKGPRTLGGSGCLYPLGCKGRFTYADCPTRLWNGGAARTPGVNWCIGARSPCHGCTQPNFPDGMTPFLTLSGLGVKD